MDKVGKVRGQRKYPLPVWKTKFPWKRNPLNESPEYQLWMKWLKEISGMGPELFNKVKGLGLFSSYIYPECDDIEAYELMLKFLLLLFFMDDHEECKGGDIDRDVERAAMIWGQYEEMTKSLNGTKVPMHRWKPYVLAMYATINSILNAMRSPKERARFINANLTYKEGSLEEKICINRGQWPTSLEEMNKVNFYCPHLSYKTNKCVLHMFQIDKVEVFGGGTLHTGH